jgi:radical SAM superfamily enzyme YgiQ (UPF0313 family)
MKILLCSSYLGQGKPEPVILPIGPAYLASLIMDNHEVHGWDPNIVENPKKELFNILEKIDPDIVGVSFRNVDSVFSFHPRSYYPLFVSMIRAIKQKVPSCKLIVGGAGFSIFPEEIMQGNPEIDFGIVSEGEYAFVELLKNLDHPEKVKNLVLRKNGRVVFTERGELVDFNSLPLPSREIFDLKKYRENPYSTGVQSKRGCSFKCIYCLHRFLMGSSYRLRSPRKVVDEIEDLINKYDVNSFYFVDPVFNVPFDHGREICREIIRRKIDVQWEACFRPEFINAEFMKEAIKAGCRLFDFSPDGASNEAMRALGKDLKVEYVEKTINLASKIEDAKVAYEFLYDLPSNNIEHISGLIRLFPKIMLRCRSKLRYLTLSKMRIYPHTPLYKIALEQGKINENTDLLYPVHYESKSSKNITNLLPYLLRGSSIAFGTFIKKTQSTRVQ